MSGPDGGDMFPVVRPSVWLCPAEGVRVGAIAVTGVS